MTIKEFLEFISQDSNHFGGFLICFGLFIALINTSLNGIANIIRALLHKKQLKPKKIKKDENEKA